MLYGLRGSGGSIKLRSSPFLLGSSVGDIFGGSSKLFEGKNETSFLKILKQSISSSARKCATPLFWLWIIAPPSSMDETFSFVTSLTTSGPVTNMYADFVMIMKSV